MITLIKNIKAFRDGAWLPSEILIADSKIEKIEEKIDIAYDGLNVFDGQGKTAIPGYIDQHVHVTGGGGEGSFITQVPSMKFSAPVKAGVTTIVGLLGTDGTTRSVANLVAKTKALNEFGLTAYCLTGNYNYPSPTLTGSVLDDIVFVKEIIGVKIAICDHRSANMTVESLIKLASDARVAGLLSGKPGIVHLHTGSGKDKLDIIFKALENSNIPITTFRPTHLAPKYDEAIKFAKMGGFVDFTCDPESGDKRISLLCKALEEVPEGLMTISTDSNGSMPIWNEKKEMVGIGAGKIDALPEAISHMVLDHNVPLEKAIKVASENVAKALGVFPAKGILAPGSDADIVLLGEDVMPDTVFAMGRLMMKDHQMQVVEPFAEV
ncbi:MAG: beta-aspartyl-peptidase [Clostridia bacterium]|nr:beta-aspartyl-peptidase [Clostridia bacterium]